MPLEACLGCAVLFCSDLDLLEEATPLEYNMLQYPCLSAASVCRGNNMCLHSFTITLAVSSRVFYYANTLLRAW